MYSVYTSNTSKRCKENTILQKKVQIKKKQENIKTKQKKIKGCEENLYYKQKSKIQKQENIQITICLYNCSYDYLLSPF